MIRADADPYKRHYLVEWVFLFAVLLIFGGYIAYLQYEEYVHIDTQERERLTAQTAVIEKNLVPQLHSANKALESVRDDLSHWRSEKDGAVRANRRLEVLSQMLPGIRTLLVVDASGKVTASNNSKLIGASLAHREWFQLAAKNNAPQTLYLIPPIKTLLNTYVMALARSITGANGEFAGVVYSSLDPDFAKILLDSVRYTADAKAFLIHGDGTLFTVVPDQAELVGKSLAVPNSLFTRHRDSGQPVSVFAERAYITNSERMAVFRTIQPTELSMDRPLVVVLSRDLRSIFANWRHDCLIHGGSLSLLALIGIFSLYYYQRSQRALDDLANRHEAARRKTETDLRIAAAAFESQEGMMVTDAKSVILRVNRAFTEITGYSADDVVGKTPRVLQSGRHDKEFYRTMWETIRSTDGWQGEIWDRRKNGEEFPKWLTISAVKDEQGEVTHYIGTQFDITERKKAEDKIKELAFFDALTGLSNRFSLQERLKQALSLAERNEKQLAVMLIDLDNFKTINDTLGHSAGDQLLIQVAKRLSDSVRQSDLVARLGGDEFVVVLPDIDSPTDAASVADKILIAVSAAYPIGGQELRTSPSIGICLYPEDGTQSEELIKKADVAMYHAKSNGKNNYQFFRDEIQTAAVKRIALETELRKALEQEQFVLYYQPQLDLRTGHLCGVEALVRWRHPERGLVMPNDFIPVAEETGLILPLGGWVLEQACRQLATWRAHGLNHIKMSVNLAASQFADPQLPMRIEEILALSGIPATSLDLEVTESMTMQSPEATAARMRVLTGQQVSLSIDDFGTGYSSLAYLKTFPLSTLKIDRSFVKDIETDQNDADICDVTVLLAHKLGFDVVAEGVETEVQLKYLLSIGCEKIQGYLISKPLPADQAEYFIRNNPPMKGLGTIDLWSEGIVEALQ